MRVYGFPGNKRDPSKGIKIRVGLYGDDYIWLTLSQAKRFMEQLHKAIRISEVKEWR